jgi:hypothetical protein
MKSHRVKILTKRMVAIRNTVIPAYVTWELSFHNRLFGYHVYSNVVHKAEREALLRIDGDEFGYKQ